jgi:hypothetical protein
MTCFTFREWNSPFFCNFAKHFRHRLRHSKTNILAHDAKNLVSGLTEDGKSESTRLLALLEEVDIGEGVCEVLLVNHSGVLEILCHLEELLFSLRVHKQVLVEHVIFLNLV